MSHISKKKGSSLWVILKKTHTQFFESNWRKRGSILWVILEEHKKSWTLWVILKDFNSVSHIEKRVKKKSSILWVIYKEFNSVSHLSKKKISIFWVSFFTQGSILWIILVKKEEVQFNESYWKTSTLLVILRRGSKKKSSILWVIYKEFNSVSHLSKKKISIFWVSFFTQGSILWIILVKKEEVQFCKSYKNSSILWVLFRKNGSIRVKI